MQLTLLIASLLISSTVGFHVQRFAGRSFALRAVKQNYGIGSRIQKTTQSKSWGKVSVPAPSREEESFTSENSAPRSFGRVSYGSKPQVSSAPQTFGNGPMGRSNAVKSFGSRPSPMGASSGPKKSFGLASRVQKPRSGYTPSSPRVSTPAPTSSPVSSVMSGSSSSAPKTFGNGPMGRRGGAVTSSPSSFSAPPARSAPVATPSSPASFQQRVSVAKSGKGYGIAARVKGGISRPGAGRPRKLY